LVFDQIQANQFPIGHLKFFLETADWQEKISFTTTSTSRDVRIGNKESSSTKVLINARVQCEPRALQELVDRVLTNAESIYNCTIAKEKWSVFKPGYPRPTHRMA
jgi:hypothetical protein